MSWYPLCMTRAEYEEWLRLNAGYVDGHDGRHYPCSTCPGDYAAAMKAEPTPQTRPRSTHVTHGRCNPPTRRMALFIQRRIAVHRAGVQRAELRRAVLEVRSMRSRPQVVHTDVRVIHRDGWGYPQDSTTYPLALGGTVTHGGAE